MQIYTRSISTYANITICVRKCDVRTTSTVKSQVQGAKVTTSHWTHVTEGCNSQPLQLPPLEEHGHCGVHNAAIKLYQCTLHVFLTSPYRSYTTHYNGAHAGPDLVDCVNGCSCLL